MIPTYIREDEQFYKVYSYVEDIFEQIKTTCNDLLNDLVFDVNSKEFVKVLNMFGRLSDFDKVGIPVEGLVYNANATPQWTVIRGASQNLNVTLTNEILYFYSKFNALKNNFDGTYISFKTSINKLFDKQTATSGEAVSFTNQIYVVCSQDIVEDNNNIEHQRISMVMILSQAISSLVPPESAYNETPEAGVDPHSYKNLKQSWIDDNTEQYNTYINLLNLLSLFENGCFKLEILGVVIEFYISGNAPVLKWGNSVWNESLWSSTTIQEEE